jgi:hypothetical protein
MIRKSRPCDRAIVAREAVTFKLGGQNTSHAISYCIMCTIQELTQPIY